MRGRHDLNARTAGFSRVAALGLLLATALPGQARIELRFNDARELPALGLQLRILSNAREVPLPSVTRYPYRVQIGDIVQERVEMIAPREVWVSGQQAAEWRDPHGNLMRLARVRQPLPGPFPREHVIPSDYEARAEAERASEDWTLQELERWVADFAGLTAVSATRPETRPPRFADLIELTSAETNAVVTLFRLNPRPPQQAGPPGPWILAWFQLAPDTDPTRARQALRTRFWPYVQPLAPAARTAPAEAAPGGDARSPAFRASQAQVAESIQHLEDWWLLEADPYVLVTNMRSGERQTARQLLVNLTRLHNVFAQLVPPRVPSGAVSVIRIPRTTDEYLAYVGPALAWSGGMWLPHRKELVLRSTEGLGTRDQRDSLFRAAYHEGFHQFVYHALDHITPSAWYNEGHAALFESVEIQNRGVTIREDPAKTRVLLELMEARQVAVTDILALSYEGFYAGEQTQRIGHYVLAWGFVHYLRHGLQNRERSPFARILPRYLDALMETRNEQVATEVAFAGIDREALQRDFQAFWASPSRRATAERNRY